MYIYLYVSKLRGNTKYFFRMFSNLILSFSLDIEQFNTNTYLVKNNFFHQNYNINHTY